jgi:hypothetical protein
MCHDAAALCLNGTFAAVQLEPRSGLVNKAVTSSSGSMMTENHAFRTVAA